MFANNLVKKCFSQGLLFENSCIFIAIGVILHQDRIYFCFWWLPFDISEYKEAKNNK